jgi:hypothetical protein
LTTRFCEIRFPEPAPVKAFGGIEIKKNLAISASNPKRFCPGMLSEIYFGGEIHTQKWPGEPDPKEQPGKD